MKTLSATIALAAAALPALALAQGPQVDVRLGPAVQARRAELGAAALDQERAQLQRDVEQALRRSHAGPMQVRLVIQDIQPNRPTSKELGASTGLSPFSAGLGGAAITGEVATPDGGSRPVRYRFFPPNLQSEANFDTWGDAEQAFDELAARIASGHPPDDTRAWPAPHHASTPTGTLIPPG